MLGNIMADDLSGVENFNNIILSSIFKENPTNPTVQEYKVLSHYNTLLLFIDEAIQRSENDMNSSGQQGGSCSKPGQGKPSPGNTKNALQGLKQQLKDLMNKMKHAGEGSNPSESLSEQLGSILSQQEQMQKMINEIMNQGQFGQAAKQLMREVNQLIDQNIDNILNKSISTETIARQERIITRLLESEKAEQERDKDEKRQSIENLHEFITTPKEIDIDDMKEDSFNESLYFRLLNLNKYYLDLYQKYLNAAN
jgi:polyhydroxyalkanoate synthesis regulator phasin